MEGLVSVLAELRTLLHERCLDFLPYFAFYCFLSELLTALPSYFPGIYDFCAAKEARGGSPLPKDATALAAARARLATGMRTSVVASIMALHVSLGALYGLLSPSVMDALRHNLEAEVPLTRHLCNVAVGYFLWDLTYCWNDGAVYVVHGVACLAVFAGALRPFLHHMALVTLLFEASTPFMHLRRILIDSDEASGLVFSLVHHAFAATFFASRIAHGLFACALWWREVEGALASGSLGAERAPMVRMYQALCLLLCGLNMFWFFAKILPGYLLGRKDKDKAQ